MRRGSSTAVPHPNPLPKGEGKRRKWAWRIAAGLALAVALPVGAFLVLSWAFPFSLGALEDARASRRATAILDREGSILRVFAGRDDSWMIWVGLDQANPRLVQATLAVEDQRFYGHHGVDPLAVLRAGWQNASHGRTVSGASTVTMQVVRLVENRPRRSREWRHKLVEAFRALQIERLLSKPQILEWYLNLAPYGGNRVGVEAASLAYFGKHASDLTLAEAALLAGLPQSPTRLRPDRNPERAKARRDHVLQRMFACGTITGEELGSALAEPVRVTRSPAPVDGLHFALMVSQAFQSSSSSCSSSSSIPGLSSSHRSAVGCIFQRSALIPSATAGRACYGNERGAFEDSSHRGAVRREAEAENQGESRTTTRTRTRTIETVFRTTLDRRVQGLSERAIREAVDRLRAEGISNGAVVVIENATGAVRALVGSCDFFSVPDQGQVNGATAPRSPGSALKPFTYALAFELGLATPDSLLADVPANYTGYEPENYDRQYRGPVSARDALVNSLNVPAVRLCEQVGQPALYGFLRELGLTTLTRDARHYGLALTLGSTEVTLLELTNAYATLARLGVYRPYRLLETEPVAAGRRLLSEGAAYLVAEVLADTTRLEGSPSWRPAGAGARMAWKTGTSYGHRDAWTFAYTPGYTVGVWLGNFSGKPSRELVGVRAAAPVAARILDQIQGGHGRTWYSAPASVGARRICALSGMPVGPHCPRAAEGLFVRGRSSDRACSVHVETQVDENAGVRLCPLCARGRDVTVKVLEVWPAELAAWLRQHGRGESLAPPHCPTCARRDEGEVPPLILSPASGQRYIFQENDGHARQRLLLKAASRAGKVYWFIDGALHTAGVPLEPAFWPLERGAHTIVCSDDAGRSSSVAIEVR